MDIKVKSFKLNPKPNGSHDQHFPSLAIEEFTPITVQYLYLLLSWWAPTNCSCLHVKHAIKCLCCDRYTICTYGSTPSINEMTKIVMDA